MKKLVPVTTQNYNELYNLYEDNTELHTEIEETGAAEGVMSIFLHTLDDETAFQLDLLVGRLIRAYELQGFLFGAQYTRVHV